MNAVLPVITILLVFSLSGCVGVSTFFRQKVALVPATAPAGPPPARPAPSYSSPAPLTLEQCIEIARTNNPSLAAGSGMSKPHWLSGTLRLPTDGLLSAQTTATENTFNPSDFKLQG